MRDDDWIIFLVTLNIKKVAKDLLGGKKELGSRTKV